MRRVSFMDTSSLMERRRGARGASCNVSTLIYVAQRQFKPFIEEKQKAAARFADWFAPRTRGRLWLRNLVTRALGLPVVGNVIAARSFGDRFRLPDG